MDEILFNCKDENIDNLGINSKKLGENLANDIISQVDRFSGEMMNSVSNINGIITLKNGFYAIEINSRIESLSEKDLREFGFSMTETKIIKQKKYEPSLLLSRNIDLLKFILSTTNNLH